MQYTLIDPKPLGDNDPKYGQTWWSKTHDSDKPVMFNLMSGTVGDGAVISFEESVNKQSAKGTEYLRLRKVKVETGGQSNPTPTKDDEKLLTLIYENTEEILRILGQSAPPKSLKEQWNKTTGQETTGEDVVDEDIGDDPIDLSAIPF